MEIIMKMREFRDILYGVERSYDDFVCLVISFVKMPGNAFKAALIKDYIDANPSADSSDVLEYMIKDLGMLV